MLNHYVGPEDRLSEKDKMELRRTIVETVQQKLDASPPDTAAEYRVAVQKLIKEIYAKIADEFPLTKLEQDQFFSELKDEITGFGPIQPLLADPEISEIMIYGPEQVYIEKNGKLEDTEIKLLIQIM